MLYEMQITYPIATPEIAFTGDTMSDFVIDPDNADVLKARILVMEVIILPVMTGITHQNHSCMFILSFLHTRN